MTPKTLRLALLALIVLAAPALAAAPAGDADRAELVIDSGRLAVMMDESRELLARLPAYDAAPHPDTPQGNRAVVYDSLVASVLGYNVLAHEACRSHAVAAALCAGPYLPPWLGKPRDYKETELRAMIRATEERLQPFWAALCARAPKPAGGEPVCPME